MRTRVDIPVLREVAARRADVPKGPRKWIAIINDPPLRLHPKRGSPPGRVGGQRRPPRYETAFALRRSAGVRTSGSPLPDRRRRKASAARRAGKPALPKP